MKPIQVLSIDESGKASYSHTSKEFALIGIVIEEKFKLKLTNSLSRLKIKYFGDDTVILHYMEIIRKIGIFSILKDKETENSFWSDLLSILNNPKIHYFFTIVDKEKASLASWKDKTIVQRSYSRLIKMFVCSILPTDKGKIITESDTSQDVYLTKAHNAYQSQGIKECGLSAKGYCEKITSLSFVNKNNNDPEVQLADLLGPTIRLKYQLDHKNPTRLINNIEKKKLKLLERKINSDNSNISILI